MPESDDEAKQIAGYIRFYQSHPLLVGGVLPESYRVKTFEELDIGSRIITVEGQSINERGEEVIEYSTLFWQISQKYGKIPSEITPEFLDQKLKEGEEEFARDAQRRGEKITPRDEFDRRIRDADERISKFMASNKP